MKLVITEAMRNQIGILHDKFVEDDYDIADWFGYEFKEEWSSCEFADLIRSIHKDCEDGVEEEHLIEKYLV